MSTLKMGDASAAAALRGVTSLDVAAFYGGGDTPHVWTLAEIEATKARYRLPIFTRSNPTKAGVTPAGDANTFIAWLREVRAPDCLTALDLETAIDPAYVSGFNSVMTDAGWKVSPYGSKSSLFHNPRCYGYWVADITGQAHLYPGTIITQYQFDNASTPYDLSTVSGDLTSVLWDTQAGTVKPIGQSGNPHVAILQEEINSTGYTPKLVVDGVKGPETKKAFTFGMSHAPTLSQGKTNAPKTVKVLQAMLNCWADVLPVLAVDGSFGPDTTKAVRAFQLHYIGAAGDDGIAGPKTKAALAK